jgi:septal ring factor EnvC (AmiA/AmiB activator)
MTELGNMKCPTQAKTGLEWATRPILTVSDFSGKEVAMKTRDFLLVVMFALASAMWAQDRLAQAPPGSGTANQMRVEERQKMIEMHKEEMEGMRTDIEKMKASLAQMKANLFTIKDTNEFSRWRDNADMWELMITQMDRMQKNMESMGGPPPVPPIEKKPE